MHRNILYFTNKRILNNCCKYARFMNFVNRFQTSTEKLPKPSRFAEQIGLQKQFESVQIKMKEQQKSTVKQYNFMLWVILCILGSFAIVYIAQQKRRKKIGLLYQLFALSLRPHSMQQAVLTLKKLTNYQNRFLKNRIYEDKQILSLISRCIDVQIKKQSQKQVTRQYFQLMDKCLLNNTKNKINKLQCYDTYNKYLQKLCFVKQFYGLETAEMKQIITYLLQEGEFKTVYLVNYLDYQKILNVYQQTNQENANKFRQRLTQFKNGLAHAQKDIKVIQENNPQLLLDPYKFQCQIKRKWIKFIQINMAKFTRS